MFEVKRDGGWAWFVLFSVFCSQTILGGVCLSGGLFYVIFMDALGSSPVETSWLCSLPITLWFIASPLGSFLTNRYGYRVCTFSGGIVAALGLSLGYFANHIGVLFVTHGILTGFGMGLNYTGCIAALNIYFDKYKTIATGLSSIGHNLGMVIYAEFLVFLEGEYGWRGMILLNGAITFHMCAFASVLLPLKVHGVNDQSSNQNTENNNDAKKIEKKSFNVSVFRKLSFVLFCASNIFTNVAQGIYILHLPSYSRYAGFTERDFGTVFVVYGVCNIVGKVVYSFLGQHPRCDATVLYAASLAATGICLCLIPVFLTKSGMLILTGLVGFFYCVTGALLSAVIYTIVGFERFADGVGMSLPFKATGNLIGGPFAGFLFASTGNYATSFYLGGIAIIVASLCLVQPIVHHRRQKANDKHKDIYTMREIAVPEGDIANDVENVVVVNSSLIPDTNEVNENHKMLLDSNGVIYPTKNNINGTEATDSLLKQ